MNNIRVLSHKSINIIPVVSEGDGTAPRYIWTEFAQDPESMQKYIGCMTSGADGNSRSLLIFRFDDENLCEESISDVGSIPISDPDVCVVGMEYLLDESALCIAFSSGEVILLSIMDTHKVSVEQIGQFEGGLKAMKWSPHQEMAAFVTGQDNLVQMNKYFDVVNEQRVLTGSFGAEEFVNVGWGKKETQFHGTIGRKNALELDAKLKSSIGISPDDDMIPRLSWRGDGQFLCVSIVDSVKGSRVFRVYDNEMTHLSTSEPVDKLEHNLSWRPSGNWITTSQRSPNGHDIVFFERNGLRHRDFRLFEMKEGLKVKTLSWNPDSDMLAVWISGDFDSYVEIWTMHNYHWYRKHVFSIKGQKVEQIGWSKKAGKKFFAIMDNGDYHVLSLHSQISCNSSLNMDSCASVSVIDAHKACVTPFTWANVPPPMSLFSVCLENQIHDICYMNQENDMAILSSDGKVYFFSGKKLEKKIGSIELLKGYSRQICFCSPDQICVLRHEDHRDFVDLITFESSDINVKVASYRTFSVEEPNLYLLTCIENRIYAETDTGNVYELQEDTFSPFFQLPQVCHRIHVVENGENTSFIIGLSHLNGLYFGTRLFASNCTSFHIHPDFLIYSTLDHKTHFVPTAFDLSCFTFQNFKGSNLFDESFRRIERGAEIVTCIPGGVELILQMPRGNLETVYPRALVLSRVRRLIMDENYGEALLLCRKHRIDMNILCDFQPQKFLDDVDKFIIQVNDCDHLNLFLSALKDEDVVRTMYGGIISNNSAGDTASKKYDQSNYTIDGKMNYILTLMRKSFEKIDPKKYLHPILTTYVCQKPQRLENLLNCIKHAKSEYGKDVSEKALKYSCVFVNAEKLYDAALGMYDFQMAVLVAKQTHKDPKDYLPFLKYLKSLPEFYCYFKIDQHLGKHESAFKNLSKAGDDHFDELIDFMQRHNLYNLALDIYENNEIHTNRILQTYGDYLEQYGKYEDAAFCFIRCKNVDKAIDNCLKAGLWQQLFFVAFQNNFEETRIKELSREMADELIERNDFGSAAEVLLTYAECPEEAVECCFKSKQFSRAFRLISQYKMEDLISTLAKPMILDFSKDLQEELDSSQRDFVKYSQRLFQVRQEKKERVRKEYDSLHAQDELDRNMAAVPDDQQDVFSDTSSMRTRTATSFASTQSSQMTGMSTLSFRTAKNRKKMERKKMSGRKGSAYEEEYLLTSLEKIINKLPAIKQELGIILEALLMLDGERSRASKLQDQFIDLVQFLRKSYREVFEPPYYNFDDMPVYFRMRLLAGVQKMPEHRTDEEQQNDDTMKLLTEWLKRPPQPNIVSRSKCMEIL